MEKKEYEERTLVIYQRIYVAKRIEYESIVGEVDVKIKDTNVKPAICISRNDPHLKTFDET